jgi:ribosomal protein S18 acetylase RimI-like enzyme
MNLEHQPPPSLLVRDATTEDLDTTAALIDSEAGGGIELWRERFAEALADPMRHFLVAVVDEKIVGFGQSRLVTRSSVADAQRPEGWYLSGLTVAPWARRRGVGTLLTQARINRLRDLTDSVFYAAEEENEPTLILHRRLGFVPIGTVWLPGHERALILERLSMLPPS